MDQTLPDVASVPSIPGSPFAGGFFAGIIESGGSRFAIVVANREEGERVDIAWSDDMAEVAGARSFHDGLANTEAMAAAGSELGKWARGLRIGGHDDWYIPSRDELELCYRNLKPTKDENATWRGDNPSSVPPGYPYFPFVPTIAEAAHFQHGGAEAFGSRDWYWSSTQHAGNSLNAWGQDFVNGTQSNFSKDYEGRARAVRRFLITQ